MDEFVKSLTMAEEVYSALIEGVIRKLIKNVDTHSDEIDHDYDRVEMGIDVLIDTIESEEKEIMLKFSHPIPITVHLGKEYVKYAPKHRDAIFKARLPLNLISLLGDRPSKKSFARARDAVAYRDTFVLRFELSQSFAEVEDGS